ncbi:hypothetical protein BGX29_010267 [Mortierella sp. GBA35]|nr:hypothetical protein BGX29_010267 [Mortierella sp. GBA35]KAG0201907.1 hypothetical protein BGX33_010041 [Mortierella sp. NVP41]
MALVCANSYWICERCHSHSKVPPQGDHNISSVSYLPLRVQVDGGQSLSLCLRCRRLHYQDHPKHLRMQAFAGDWGYDMDPKLITVLNAFNKLRLKRDQLEALTRVPVVVTNSLLEPEIIHLYNLEDA